MPVHGRGAAHPQPPAVPRAAHLHREPRRRPASIIVDDDLVPLLAPGGRRPEDGRALHRRRRRRRTALVEAGAPRREVLRYDDAPRGADARASTGPRSTNAPPRRCATRAAPPGTRRASSTRTGRRSCTRWRRSRHRACRYTRHDRVLPIVPMFHANAWGIAVRGLDGRRRPPPARAVTCRPSRSPRSSTTERPTCDVRACPRSGPTSSTTPRHHDVDFSSLERIMCGGSAVPRALMERVPGALRRPHAAGVGDDRDQPARPRCRSRPGASSPARRGDATGGP